MTKLDDRFGWPFFDDAHRDFVAALRNWLTGVSVLDEESRSNESPRAWVAALADAGWLRACVPKAFGGLREKIDGRSLCLARETLAFRSSLADFAFAMQGLGSGPISLFGGDALCEEYLPKVVAGNYVAAFALSEKEAGSDVAALRTRARRDGDVYVIDGGKHWISNAGIADFYVVFARTGEEGTRGLSAFVVDATLPGCRVEESIETISPHPLGTLAFDGVRVASDRRIGAEGEGFKIAMATLDLFRSTVGAAAIGFATRALHETLQHVRGRRLFGAPLADLQLTQATIARMATDIDAGALLVYRAAWLKDCVRDRVTAEAAMAKWFATEAAGRVCDNAVQLFGGRGVTRGEMVERLYRDVRALRIYEGASEIQQIVIARHTLER